MEKWSDQSRVLDWAYEKASDVGTPEASAFLALDLV